MHDLPETPVVFHDVKHEIELEHVRKQLQRLLNSAKNLSWKVDRSGKSIAAFQASSPHGTESISFELGCDSGGGQILAGVTVHHRLNGHNIFKIVDSTREGGNRYPTPPATFKGRDSLEHFMPMLSGWAHLARHAMSRNGIGAFSPEIRAEAIKQRQQQQTSRDSIISYIAAAAANTGIDADLTLTANWPTGNKTGSLRIWGPGLNTRAILKVGDEIIRHFKTTIGDSWELRFKASGTGVLQVLPVEDRMLPIPSLGIVETMKIMRDPRFKGLSFRLGN